LTFKGKELFSKTSHHIVTEAHKGYL